MSSQTQENWTKERVSKIIGIQFSVLSPDEIRKNSVAEITSRDTYNNNIPVISGMFDPRLGVIEPGLKCLTDGLDYMKTPGYFGHIELAKPVFYYQYLTTIVKILKCVCIKCSKLLINKDTNKSACLEMRSDERWGHVHQLCSKIKRCGDDTQDGCGCLTPRRIKKENLATLFAEYEGGEGETGGKEKLNMKLTPEIVLKIFKRISDQDVAFMGFSPIYSRPDWFICQVLAVPPPAVRPSIKVDGSHREDDISLTIVSILKTNKILQTKLNDTKNPAMAGIIDDYQDLLQYYIATQVDNNIPSVSQVAQRSGRPLKSIKERLNGKGGRVRGNLMGKRVDFSARSVITPDPNISIRELGVPKRIAMNLTKPVVVNNRNRDFLQMLVSNGPHKYPGANYIQKKTGIDISLGYNKNKLVLENGDVVHRHMMDGDGVLFNRQPTLHRMSMMCHIARIMDQGDTFRMNIGDTKPYNADFDGDEMNLHMPQDDESEAELKNLAAVHFQIISPAKNQSIIGIFQDSLLGSYQFTKSEIQFDARMAMNLLIGYKFIDTSLFANPKKKITNFEILSQILPNLSLKYKTKQFGEGEDYAKSNNVLEIVNGEMKRGILDSGVLASSTNGMIQRICNDFGNMAASNFIDDLQNIITEYMKHAAYSVGISDLMSDSVTTEKIFKSIIDKKKDVKTIIDNIHIGTFENKSGRTNEEEFELQVTNILNKANGEAGDIGLKSLNKDNRFITMVNAGSKGSKVNIAQMICLVGQQTIDGKRIPYGFDSRTLPHYAKYDDSPGARGFVENSFINGLTPSEVFFHAMGGRVGLIDTAVKSITWETPIIIVENAVPKYVKIGQWIDEHIETNLRRVQHMEEQNMEYLELTHPVYIVTMDYEGRVSWESITAVTRHDPGEKLFKISTKAGRYVTVTANKSLLIWNAELNQFREEYTEDVKVGDFVPVAKNVCDFQTQKNEIQLDGYFPRSEYVYGSEIHKAIILMKEAMKNRKKIQENWWNENNNNNFTLPFVSKARFQRAIVRSKLESISHNGIYTSNGTRQHSIIPETFSLSYDNGVFIGLFIAEGNINNSKIYITNNDETIRAFVKGWFSKYNIAFTETIKKNKIGGTTTTICGSSCILSKLITMMVGHGAKNKHVPNEAYISNIDFVKGILSGYISGDGYISKNSINSSSCCRRLSEDISLLCSRIGVHAKLSVLKKNNLGTKNIQPSYRVSIRAVNGRQFAEQITLLHPEKNNKMKSIIWTTKLDTVKTINDAILDEIISIEHVNPANHPKMYDLTIPKTLNFGLANGLQVRDTSQTGYIQRRLIKGMEDLKVEYDMTVRNSKNRIVQFRYGEDGIDAVKIETQQMNFITFTLDEIYAHFHVPIGDDFETMSNLKQIFTKEAIVKMKKETIELNKRSKFYSDLLIQMRDNIVKVQKYKNTKDAYLPISFHNIIANIQGMQRIDNNSMVDITPLEVFKILEATFEKLKGMHYTPPTDLYKIMYYYSLTPRELLIVKRYNRKSLMCLMEMIVLMYKRALITPGEMVGMIAAQSIGEPTTQLTLNTFHLSGDASKSQVTRGLPRIEELLSLSENTKNPSTTIYLKKQDEGVKENATQLIPTIELTRLEDVVTSVEICFDPSDNTAETKISMDKGLLAQYAEFNKFIREASDQTATSADNDCGNSDASSKWVLRLEMNRTSMYEKQLTMDDVHFAIKTHYVNNEVSCIYSDYNDENLIFRIRLKKKSKGPKPLDQTDEIYMLKMFQDNLMKNIILRGIKGIQTVLARKRIDLISKENATYTKKEIWVLDTVGSNLMEILSMGSIDAKRTISNDIQEINRVLGIEAARQALMAELEEAFDTTYINHHHISLLCDRMTANSSLISIFRHGINNDDIGPIAKASFEETPEMFLKAARHAELDTVRGISANVMCGQEGFYGTNSFAVLLNMNEIMKTTAIQEEEEEAEEAEAEEAEAESAPCSKQVLLIESKLDNDNQSMIAEMDPDYEVGF